MSSTPTCFAELVIGIPKELSVKLSEEDAIKVIRSNITQMIHQLTQTSASVEFEVVLNFQVVVESTDVIANLVPASSTLQ